MQNDGRKIRKRKTERRKRQQQRAPLSSFASMSPLSIPGTFLCQSRAPQHEKEGNHDDHDQTYSASDVLISDVSLSFWGGIHPETGLVVDATHPLGGQNVKGRIFCLPSGRGSCTASQVLLELLLNDQAPRAIVLRDVDGLAAVGALVAEEVFQHAGLDILWVGEQGFQELMEYTQANPKAKAFVTRRGQLLVGNDGQELTRLANESKTEDSKELGKQEQLSAQEQALLDQSQSEAERMALRVIFRYARIMKLGERSTTTTTTAGNNALLPPTNYKTIRSAHIDGCTYIGPAGLAFARQLAESGRVKVPTTLNAVSADRRQWRALGVPEPYAQNSQALGDAYLALGCQPSFTCAPYLLGGRQAREKNDDDDDVENVRIDSSRSSTTNTASTSTTTITPQLGDDICWGESNAVVYANSVLGARTDKYADYLDICCAIAGIVPELSVHVMENRRPQILLDASELVGDLKKLVGLEENDTDVDVLLQNHVDLDALFPVLGHLCGTKSDGKVPLLLGLDSWAKHVTKDHLKAFCAAFGTTGTSPLIHIHGITPEAVDDDVIQEWTTTMTSNEDSGRTILTTVPISLQDIHQTFATLDKDRGDGDTDDDSSSSVKLIALGNPHLSVTECERLVNLIREPQQDSNGDMPAKKHDDVRVMACMSRELYQQAETLGYIPQLQEFGMEFINDTCWCMLLDEPVIPPIPTTADASDSAGRLPTILTNSGKYAHYGPGLTGRPFRFASTADCMTAATTGRYPTRNIDNIGAGAWLLQRRQMATMAAVRTRPVLLSTMAESLQSCHSYSSTTPSIIARRWLPRLLFRR